jgi:glycosyltransferase involved in cell wall biosynthesis
MEREAREHKIKVAIVGCAGVPACYGGFETLAENIIINREKNIQYSIVCSSKIYKEKKREYHGAYLKYLHLAPNGWTSIPYDILSYMYSLNSDIMLVLGVSGALFLPILRLVYKGKIIVNVDGIEWRRAKWTGIAKRLLRWSELSAVKYCDNIIADNKAILDYIQKRYNKVASLIEYGGDHVNIQKPASVSSMHGNSQPYSITVCRIEPENNIHIILEAFSSMKNYKIVVVGNWNSSNYGKDLRKKYVKYENISLYDPIYNKATINSLRTNASLYVHGHSAGGTNPSLVEAMSLGMPILAFDCEYNRETTEGKCQYFNTIADIKNSITTTSINDYNKIGFEMEKVASRRYKWENIIRKYETLFSATEL